MSASPPTTAVSVSATLDYDGTPIPVNSGDLNQLRKGNFQFELTRPVLLGSLDDFLQWLQRQLSLPDLNGEVRSAIRYLQTSSIPVIQSLGNLLAAIWDGKISITTLVINTATKTYMFGVTMEIGADDSPPGFPLFGGLSLNSIGFLVAHGEQAA